MKTNIDIGVMRMNLPMHGSKYWDHSGNDLLIACISESSSGNPCILWDGSEPSAVSDKGGRTE